MKVLFAGSPDIAVPSLEITARYHDVRGVLCAPDAPQGRSRALVPCAVKARALELGIPCFSPQRLDAEARAEVAPLGADLLVCFAYGKLFGPRFLSLFPRGGINIHPSLLPDLRGPSPLASAILFGRTTTGISIQYLAQEMDAGDILAARSLELDGSETAGSLGTWAAAEGANLLREVLGGLDQGECSAHPQDHGLASYCHLLDKKDGCIDWSRPAIEIERAVRAFDPWPRAWTTWRGQQLSLLASHCPTGLSGQAARPGTVLSMDKGLGILVQTGQGILAVRDLQVQGKKPMDAATFMNGARDFLGSILGDT